MIIRFAAALLIASAAIASTKFAQAADAPAKPAIPTLKVTTIDGKPYDLAKQRGNWVVVNYWATWCAPCRKEMPDLSKFDAERKDVGVIGLAFEDTELDDIKNFIAKFPVSYPIAHVDPAEPPADFEAPRGLPLTYLVAPDGKVAERFIGPVTSEMLAESIVKHQKK